MKSSLFTATLGLGLFGAMLSSSTGKETAASATQALPVSAPAAAGRPTSIPFTVYLSLITAFTNGQSIDFNTMDEEGQSFIFDKMSDWREEQ